MFRRNQVWRQQAAADGDGGILGGGDDNPDGTEPGGEGQPGGEAAEWFLAEGLKGEGERPEWFNGEKYKTVAEQAKAQRELEKKLGGFTGAPEGDYELSLPEGIEGQFDLEHPILQDFKETAKAANMSQETFSALLHKFVEYEATSGQVDIQREREALGPKADSRIASVRDYLKANLPDEVFQAFKGELRTAAAVEALETLIGKTRAPLPNEGGEDFATADVEKLRDLREQKDDQGRRLYDVDPEHRRKVRALYSKIYGDQPAQEIVGRR